jgi:DNA-binding XRE family transcriptional regulator
LPFCGVRLSGPRPFDFAITYARNPRTVGEHLRKERLYRGLTQRDLARTLKVRTETPANWENNRVQPLVGGHPLPRVRSRTGATVGSVRLASIHRRLGLTQAALAEWLRIDPGTVRNLEQGGLPRNRRVRAALVAWLREETSGWLSA